MTAEAPPAPPPAPAKPAAAPAPSSAPPPNLVDPLPTPGTPPRPGSARERMRTETGKKWGDEKPAVPASTANPPPGDTPPPTSTPEKPAPETPPAKPADEPAAPDTSKPPADLTPEQKKKNPWHLYRGEKERADKLEQQIAEAKASSLAETERAELQSRIEKAEAKTKEYEEEIRFKSYEKSDEFKTKYEEPYAKAWDKHMRDLSQVPVLGEDGNQRMAKHEDLLDLMNLPLAEARKMANEKWGEFSQDAMIARKEIRDLFEKKTQALDEARKTGADREKQFQENAKKWREQTQAHIKATWDSEHQKAMEHPVNGEFFKPVDGDETRNQILGKGFALVDAAFSKSTTDPRLTPEEREAVIRKQVAVRNRAAAFGPMKYLILKLRQQLADLEKAHSQLQGSTPPAGGGTAAAGPGAPQGGSARDKMRAAGDKYARSS